MDSYDLAMKLGETVAGFPYQNKTDSYVIYGVRYHAELKGQLHHVMHLARQSQWRTAIGGGAEGAIYLGMGLGELVVVKEPAPEWLK